MHATWQTSHNASLFSSPVPRAFGGVVCTPSPTPNAPRQGPIRSAMRDALRDVDLTETAPAEDRSGLKTPPTVATDANRITSDESNAVEQAATVTGTATTPDPKSVAESVWNEPFQNSAAGSTERILCMSSGKRKADSSSRSRGHSCAHHDGRAHVTGARPLWCSAEDKLRRRLFRGEEDDGVDGGKESREWTGRSRGEREGEEREGCVGEDKAKGLDREGPCGDGVGETKRDSNPKGDVDTGSVMTGDESPRSDEMARVGEGGAQPRDVVGGVRSPGGATEEDSPREDREVTSTPLDAFNVPRCLQGILVTMVGSDGVAVRIHAESRAVPAYAGFCDYVPGRDLLISPGSIAAGVDCFDRQVSAENRSSAPWVHQSSLQQMNVFGVLESETCHALRERPGGDALFSPTKCALTLIRTLKPLV